LALIAPERALTITKMLSGRGEPESEGADEAMNAR
jgi:hypothetical protein